jgi:hypothetical protein
LARMIASSIELQTGVVLAVGWGLLNLGHANGPGRRRELQRL